MSIFFLCSPIILAIHRPICISSYLFIKKVPCTNCSFEKKNARDIPKPVYKAVHLICWRKWDSELVESPVSLSHTLSFLQVGFEHLTLSSSISQKLALQASVIIFVFPTPFCKCLNPALQLACYIAILSLKSISWCILWRKLEIFIYFCWPWRQNSISLGILSQILGCLPKVYS